MNRRGFELAISTLIVIVLSVFILIALVYVFSDGFKRFQGSTQPLSESGASSAVREGCRLACTNGDRFSYCCRNVTLGTDITKCSDPRFELECSLTCDGYQC